jgi:hypothetical protein
MNTTESPNPALDPTATIAAHGALRSPCSLRMSAAQCPVGLTREQYAQLRTSGQCQESLKIAFQATFGSSPVRGE